MARIHDDEIRQLKENISLADVCRSRGIELKKHGSRDLIGPCPFHPDKKPSFVVSPHKNLFHCLGCEAAGSVIDLVMKLDGLSFRQAVDKLLGSTSKLKRASAPAAAEKEKITLPPERANQLLERVIAVYEKTFADPAGSGTNVSEGRAYLETRGITDAGLFTQYRIGFSNGRLKEILPDDERLKKELQTLGVLLDNPSTGSPQASSGRAGRERFAGCVVVPVFDADGNLTTLYGRFTGEGSPSTSLRAGKRHVFLPDRSTGLWNAAAMKTYSEIILVESVIDALSVMVAGYRNVIAIQGTNGLNEAEIAALREHGVQSVTLLLDGDEAGRKAAERLKE
ncbi:MAG: toprim domain-containing protein, partial [Kiritimatiellae bacterium]|nr:toprim domain-containing protein [Kiritimatiellia bacterium]